MAIIITCEHGGNQIPKDYQHLFTGKQKILNSHRGWDPGALILAANISDQLATPFFSSEISRLLIDLNRSSHHPKLFSELSALLNKDKKNALIDNYYSVYRNNVENTIHALLQNNKRVVHLAIHSFTPILNGQERNADIGLLYNPARATEKKYCADLKNRLQDHFSEVKVRSNYPYQGKADGFTTYLRKIFPASMYIGVEIEINQKHVKSNSTLWRKLQTEFSQLL